MTSHALMFASHRMFTKDREEAGQYMKLFRMSIVWALEVLQIGRLKVAVKKGPQSLSRNKSKSARTFAVTSLKQKQKTSIFVTVAGCDKTRVFPYDLESKHRSMHGKTPASLLITSYCKLAYLFALGFSAVCITNSFQQRAQFATSVQCCSN